jgi:integrase/recombinase XerD
LGVKKTQNETPVLHAFKNYLLTVERKAKLTVTTYGYEVNLALEWCKKQGLDAEQAESKSLVQYLDERRTAQGMDSRSISKAVSALRSFYLYVESAGIRNDNPAGLLETPRKKQWLPEVSDKQTIEAMFSSIDVTTPQGLRNRAAYELLYSAGLRVSEAVGLDIDDVDFGEHIARVTGKGNKERLVIFGDTATFWLKKYLAESRPKLSCGKHINAFFLSRRGQRMSRKTMWYDYAAITGQVGMPSRLHNLRHSFATEMLAGGADLRSVQALMGHVNLGTTQIYTHVNDQALRKNYEKYMPNLNDYREGGKHGGQG